MQRSKKNKLIFLVKKICNSYQYDFNLGTFDFDNLLHLFGPLPVLYISQFDGKKSDIVIDNMGNESCFLA